MLIPALRSAAENAPTVPFLITLNGSRTYAEMLAECADLAVAVRERRLGRFGCRLENSSEVISLWLAAAWVGAEPCVFSTDADAAEVEDLAARFQLGAIVAKERFESRVAPCIPVRELFARSLDLSRSEELPPVAEPSVLILTTGTTGRPKGVRYLWSQLIAQVRRSAEHRPARWLLAYDLNHFAGVQMFLHALVNQASLVIPSSPRPNEALGAIEELGVTHVSATPTFWRVLLAQLPEERARRIPLQQITLGAEPVPPDLVGHLRRFFPSARVSQVFAATEVGSCLAVSDGLPGLPASILDRDEGADVRFRVVDGELSIKSRHGMIGYVGDDTPAEAEWRSTGDLVERRGDRLCFVGRRSETINVGGVKVHPLPIEERAQLVDGVCLAHAYGRRNPVTGEIVALDVVAAVGVDLKELEARIRSACATLPRAAQPRVVRFVETLETRNQKVVRRHS